MLKGVKKNIIVVRPPQKSSFEKVFFVLKRRQRTSSTKDILREADRIVNEGIGGTRSKRLGRGKCLLCFLLGFASSFAMSLVVYFVYLAPRA